MPLKLSLDRVLPISTSFSMISTKIQCVSNLVVHYQLCKISNKLYAVFKLIACVHIGYIYKVTVDRPLAGWRDDGASCYFHSTCDIVINMSDTYKLCEGVTDKVSPRSPYKKRQGSRNSISVKIASLNVWKQSLRVKLKATYYILLLLHIFIAHILHYLHNIYV